MLLSFFVNRYKTIYFPQKSFLDGSASIEVENFLKADQTLEDFGKVDRGQELYHQIELP